MTVSHHLDDATLLLFASGSLDPAFSLVAAAHIDICPRCREGLRDGEEIGGYLLERCGEETVADAAFGRAMERIHAGHGCLDIDARPSMTFAARTRAPRPGEVPRPLQRYIGERLDDIAWRAVAPGVKKHVIMPDGETNSSLYMLHIAAGRAVPEHGHGGSEITLVLRGVYRDSLGRFGPGDVADLDEHVEHQPRVEPGEACVCLVATEQPTRFKGFFSRLLQPLIGI